MRRTIRYTALVVIMLAGTGGFAAAQSPCAGCPDLSFGTNGIVPIPSFGGAIGTIGVQHLRGEELIVALDTYRWKLARYRFRPGGGVELDANFGSLGTITHPNSRATAYYGMVVQPDNKLVVAGALRGRNSKEPWVLIVVRYNEDGSVDSGFGQNGTVTFSDYSGARPPRLQPDGKLLLAVGIYPGDTHVIRLDQQGLLDTTFDEDGIAVLHGVGAAKAIAVQPLTDTIVVSASISRPTKEIDPLTGQVTDKPHYLASLTRLHSDGSLDTSFANGGTLERDEPDAYAVSFDDVTVDRYGIVTGGYIAYRINDNLDYHPLVERYRPDGVCDFTFTESLHKTRVKDVLIGPDGKILAVGLPMPTYANSRGLAAWRLLDNGIPDPSFGEQGGVFFSVTTDPFSSMWAGFDGGPHVTFMGDGSTFLVGGSAYVQQSKRVVTDVGALGRFLY